jgi:cell division protein FtsI/penicillin-binding protein 2
VKGRFYNRTIVTRREALTVLFGGRGLAANPAQLSIDALFPPGSGAALLIGVQSRKLIAVNNLAAAGNVIAPPGSTIKPFALAALVRRRKLTASETYVCPGKLEIGGRSLNCSHPRLNVPMRIETALAYSCNCFVARMAERFEATELAAELQSAGLASRTGLLGPTEASGRVAALTGGDARRLQALGEFGIAVTLAELAMAYRKLAMRLGEAEMQAIGQGLAGAVTYGTAQRAAASGMSVAGKTGSVQAPDGARIAWFAGYAPSESPEVAVAVMLQARSGGGDAAPVAAQILEAYRKSR